MVVSFLVSDMRDSSCNEDPADLLLTVDQLFCQLAMPFLPSSCDPGVNEYGMSEVHDRILGFWGPNQGHLLNHGGLMCTLARFRHIRSQVYIIHVSGHRQHAVKVPAVIRFVADCSRPFSIPQSLCLCMGLVWLVGPFAMRADHQEREQM